MPYIEQHYRVLAGRGNRAIGDSRGRQPDLGCRFPEPGQVRVCGLFSSGAMGMSGGTDWEKNHAADVVFQESPGAHTWINWRNYLNQFAPQLFR